MLYPCYIELSKSAFKKNIEFLRDYIGDDVRFSSVIKGNAYGHGIRPFINMAEQCGIDHFSVFSADEAYKAKEVVSEGSEIMIMGMIDNEELEWAIENEIGFFVFELDRLKAAAIMAEKVGTPARIHLQLETGMNRIGLSESQLDETVKFIQDNQELFELDGVCTHYAGAESIANYFRINRQIKRFKQLYRRIGHKGLTPKYRHTACSAAALAYPETIMDMVRIGIAQYGFWPSRETYMYVMKNYYSENNKHAMERDDPLTRVISWKSRVMSTKAVDVGEFIGYGNVYMTNRAETIATVPIGYSHGFGRNLTNMGRVLINGKRAPVVGLVNMNLITVEVTDIPNVNKGDEVVIIGKQRDNEISVASFSEMSNFLNYEVLTRLPSDLPRYVVE